MAASPLMAERAYRFPMMGWRYVVHAFHCNKTPAGRIQRGLIY